MSPSAFPPTPSSRFSFDPTSPAPLLPRGPDPRGDGDVAIPGTACSLEAAYQVRGRPYLEVPRRSGREREEVRAVKLPASMRSTVTLVVETMELRQPMPPPQPQGLRPRRREARASSVVQETAKDSPHLKARGRLG